MGESPYQALGLAKVVNASGKMTALGGTAQSEPVARAQQQAARYHVELAELRRVAGEVLAGRTGAQAACVTSGAAAGIAVGVAAMITGTDEEAVRRLPDSGGRPDEILLQAGHDVDFGARVSQMVRLGGGRAVTVGEVSGVSATQLEAACGPNTAGMLFVQSHHTRQADGLALPELVAVARRRGLPVLVDAAAEEDLTRYIEEGADLVTYSGGKAIGGPTVGFLAGRRDLIEACELQNRGIARAMKVGKEQITGLLAAMERYPTPASWPERLAALKEGLAGCAGDRVSLVPDLAGRAIERVGLKLATPQQAAELASELRAGDPAIHTRNHQLGEGLVLFDLREVEDADVPLIVERVGALLKKLDQEG